MYPTMKAFIGLCFAMGILRLPSRHNYWRQNKFMFVTSFNKVMSRDRFDLIWRYLHLQDNEVVPVDEERPDKLIKIRWYLDYRIWTKNVHTILFQRLMQPLMKA
jgi:hypothetical protein